MQRGLFDNFCCRCSKVIPEEFRRCKDCAEVERLLPEYLRNESGRTFAMNLILRIAEEQNGK